MHGNCLIARQCGSNVSLGGEWEADMLLGIRPVMLGRWCRRLTRHENGEGGENGVQR